MNRRSLLGGIGVAFTAIPIPSFGALAFPDLSAAQITFSELVTNTPHLHREEIVAAVKRNNALLAKLNRNRPYTGGIEIPE